MDRKTSIRGRTARRVVKVANHLPMPDGTPAAGQLRTKLSVREKEWECPAHLRMHVLERDAFRMELLHGEEHDVEDGIILQLHGGGYYGMLHNIYRDMAALYHEVSEGCAVLNVDYRVAPEHPYPAALMDAVSAYRWILERGYDSEAVIVAGDSAGGGLALALCLYLREHGLPLPSGVITMSAWADLTKSGDSYRDNFEVDPIFGGTTDSLVYMDGYYRGTDPANPYISPIYGDFHGFPPMLMQVGEYEMLLSDTKTVARRASEDGTMVKMHVYPGMFHVFQMGLLLYPESRAAWVEAGKFIRYLRKKEKKENV